ncbi:hypothetical protein CLBKND_03405 [Methylorubrum aminovorans]
MTQEAVEKTKVTLIQGNDSQIRRVRIGDMEMAVQHAGPTVADGQMAVTMTVVGIDVDVEREQVARS